MFRADAVGLAASRNRQWNVVKIMGTMQDTVIVVTRAGLGTTSASDDAFGLDMLDKFFHTLEKQADKPTAICFYTEGVKLLAPDSPLALSLKLLERQGIRLLACQTCLDYYQLGEDMVAGQRNSIVEIVQLLGSAGKVITV